MAGTDFLDVGFDLRSVDSWAMLGILLAWIALFRFAHYAAFTYEVLPFMAKRPKTTSVINGDIELTESAKV